MKRKIQAQDQQLDNASVIRWSQRTRTHVPVVCGKCRAERLITLEKVLYHPFTGLCAKCGQSKHRTDELLENGTIIFWSRRADPYIPVQCGSCGQERLLEYTNVTRTSFTGLCSNCVNNASVQDETLEDGSTVFWSTRKGYRVNVKCGNCNKIRNVHANSIRYAQSGFCKRCVRLAERSTTWKGGRVMKGGYIHVRLYPQHRFYQEMVSANGYVAQHRLVMAEHLGRPLRKDEVVHHKNGDKTDNRIENLELYVSFMEHGQKLQQRMPHPGHIPAHRFHQILALVKRMLREEEESD